MTEPELATKSTETDAYEDTTSSIPGASIAQSGASMGEHCTTDRPAPDALPKGEMTKFEDVDVYLSKPPGYPSSPGRLLLLLTGGTGVHSTNNQLQADKFAERGYLVVMPDQFAGDPAPNSAPTMSSQDQEPTLIEKIKLGAAETAKSFMIDMWLARHTPEKVIPIVLKVLESAKDEFADAVANGAGVYGVGYCFGAKYIITLAGEHPASILREQKEQLDEEQGVASKGSLIKAGAIAHGTLVTKEDLTRIQAPVCLVCVEDDQLFPEDVLNAGRQYLESNKLEHDIRVYSGVPHGFAVVGDYSEARIMEAQASAFDQMLGWLQKY